MVTIRLCDWLKTQIPPQTPTYKVKVDGEEFEICQDSRDFLLERLGRAPGESRPDDVTEAVASDSQPAVKSPALLHELPHDPPSALQEAPPGIDVPVSDDGLGMATEPRPVAGGIAFDMGTDSACELTPTDVPQSITQRLKQPTIGQANQVVKESTVFREGSLSALTPGAAAQRAAIGQLKNDSDSNNSELNRKANFGIRLRDLNN